tara:strand:- start:193 stop:525 length:333 start_codon:yes stop_codon:yes gene_type:complete
MNDESRKTVARGIMAILLILIFWIFFFAIVHVANKQQAAEETAEETAEEYVHFILDAKNKSAVEAAFINGYRVGVERYCQTNGITNVVIYLDDMIDDAREYSDSLKGTNG